MLEGAGHALVAAKADIGDVRSRPPHTGSGGDAPFLRGVIEIVRRIALLAGLATAVCFYFDAYHGPYIQFTQLSRSSADGASATAASPTSLLGGARRRERTTEVIWVETPEAVRQLEELTAAFSGAAYKAELARREVRIGGNIHSLYFRPDEGPLAAAVASRRGGNHVVASRAASRLRLDAYLSPGKKASLGGSAPQPTSFFYPRRGLARWPLVIGILMYLLLPWPRGAANIVRVRRWRVMLAADGGSVLLFGIFFALPILILSSTRAAVGEYLGFSAIFWLLSIFGLLIAYWGAYFAAYRITLGDAAFTVATLRRSQSFSLAEIVHLEPVRIRPPRWLILLSFLAIFAGRGSSALGQAGRATLLASSQSDGWLLKTRSGTGLYVWMTDSFGMSQMENGAALVKLLKSAPVKPADEIHEIRAMFPPDWA